VAKVNGRKKQENIPTTSSSGTNWRTPIQSYAEKTLVSGFWDGFKFGFLVYARLFYQLSATFYFVQQLLCKLSFKPFKHFSIFFLTPNFIYIR